MAKWYGFIGYAEKVEITPGYWDENIIEREYYGDELRNYRALQSSTISTNDDISISNQISVVADPYATSHIYAMRYITFQNSKWKVSNVDVQYPRLIISLGGVYNG